MPEPWHIALVPFSMQSDPDPAKRILAVAVGKEGNDERVVLLLDGEFTLVTKRDGLTRNEAEVFGEGIREGLLAADPEAIEMLASGNLHVVTYREDLTPEQTELFKEGVMGGIQIAAQGYWLDLNADIPVPPIDSRSMH
jgi:hypothetical protein